MAGVYAGAREDSTRQDAKEQFGVRHRLLEQFVSFKRTYLWIPRKLP
jgi:hypothetical protein